jgi:molecular chaperone DnaK
MGHVIGIDLGTTNSCVAVVLDGRPTVIPNKGGYKTTPSMFAITENNKRLVGHIAKRQAITNPRNTIYAAKRLIGRRYDSDEVQRALKTCPYEIVRSERDGLRVMCAGREFSLPEISAAILTEMKNVAEAYLEEEINDAVVTVPAYFNDSQRQATKDGGRIAGLNILRIINEPTAAALAYGLGKNIEEKIAVYDLGGGTFDISILEIIGDVFQVLTTTGDTYLGGEDFDQVIMEHLIVVFKEKDSIDLSSDKLALQRLKAAAEVAKMELSSTPSAKINLPFLAQDENGPKHFDYTLSREKLEELTGDYVNRTIDICRSTLAESNVAKDEIAQVILVGGQTRMPMVQQKVREFFGRPPHKGVHPDEVVAIGAAIQASALTEEKTDMLLLDVTPLSLGIATYGGFFTKLITRNTTVPTSKSHIFTTAGDNQTAVRIHVLQGESDKASENELLGEFLLTGIRDAPKGEPEIEVTFDINADGIVSVSAKDLDTGRQQSIQVTASSGLTEDEIQKMIDENKQFQLELKQ